jgi:tetratricopeptide (TPR) repeat protein
MSFWNWFGSGKLKECEEKARNEPENPQCHFELATEYERREQYPQAIEAFHQTLKLSPRSAETHFNLGVLYETIGNGRQAIFHMVQAGNLFSERNDAENKDKARKKLKTYYKQFDFQPGDNPPLP